LRSCLRREDLACRYGGEEFVVVLPRCSVGDAVGVLERVQEQLVLSLTQGEVPPFTVSSGVAEAGADDTLEGVVRAADAALLQAKAKGRNRIVATPTAGVNSGLLTTAD
jgi:diguanylate cyclase (GGDEF)-like protein